MLYIYIYIYILHGVDYKYLFQELRSNSTCSREFTREYSHVQYIINNSKYI